MSHTTVRDIVPQEAIFAFDTVTLDSDGRITARRAEEGHGITLALAPDVILELAAIPGGAFLMGSPDRQGYPDERPRHAVSVAPFFLGRYPVTQAQWVAVMGPHRCRCQGLALPVDRVSWHEAVAFCHGVSRRIAEGGRTLRLPTEAEWEYACRAGSDTPFGLGPAITTDVVNYNGGFPGGAGAIGVYRHTSTQPGIFPCNAWGLGDMHGNVWEWCADAWHPSYDGAPADGRAWDEDARNVARVARGGSWHEPPEVCRSATRLKANPAHGDDLIGFRVAL